MNVFLKRLMNFSRFPVLFLAGRFVIVKSFSQWSQRVSPPSNGVVYVPSRFRRCNTPISPLANNLVQLSMRQYGTGRDVKEDDANIKLTGNPFSEIVSDRDTFLFGDTQISFDSCGIDKRLCEALEENGMPVATAIQSKAIEAIKSGRDVIVGAETGSGKTLAYLIPLIQKYLVMGRKSFTVTRGGDEDGVGGDTVTVNYPFAVIMAPNKELCNQVQRMADKIIGKLKDKGVDLTIGSPAQVSSTKWPDIIVCTPAFLSSFIKGPTIHEQELFKAIKHLVLDEGDMLLDGSYLNDVEKALDAFKLTRREMIRQKEISINDKTLQTIIVAATLPSYGLRSIEKYLRAKFPDALRVNNDHLHKHHPRIKQQFHMTNGDVTSPERVSLVAKAILGESLDSFSPSSKSSPAAGAECSKSTTEKLVPPNEPPANSKAIVKPKKDKTVASLSVEDLLEDISDDTPSVPVTSPPIAIRSTPGDVTIQDPTIVFVNTAETAQALAAALTASGIPNAEFHKMVIDPEKQENLRRFRDREVDVLICTDHAARGLDLPHVRHVVQAEFALNVVQYLHRIGRASRAGALGKATNIYDARSKDLVDSILSDTQERKVDQSFSRRRGFRQKIKKAAKREGESGGDGGQKRSNVWVRDDSDGR